MTDWLNAAGPLTGDGDTTGDSGYTRRQLIASAQISNTGLSMVRVTFESSSGEGWNIDHAYIGLAAAAGDAYDFDTTPTQLLFSGSANFSIASGTQIVSDPVTFTIPASKNLIVSWYTPTIATDSLRKKTTQTGWTNYYKNASDAATVDASGYSTATPNVAGVMRVEVAAAGGFFAFF